MLIILNVGLHAATLKNEDGTPRLLNALSVQCEVARAFHAIKPFGLRTRVAQSATEPTLVCSFEYPDDTAADDIKLACEALCATCDQDAVAIRCDETGLILGPRAAAWGAFNPEHFIEFIAPNAPKLGLILDGIEATVSGNGKDVWTVGISAGGFHGYFERHSDGHGGSLTLSLENPENGAIDGYLHLIDYDGVFALPVPVVSYLRRCGVSVGTDFE